MVDETQIMNKPYLTSHTVSSLTQTGSTYYFYLTVINELGTSDSLPIGVVLATVPNKPSTVPTQSFVTTTKKKIKIFYDALEGADTGGSPILGYDLWRDDGLEGNFSPLFTSDSILGTFYVDYNVQPARLYRYKYRARNVNGYS